MGERLDKSKSAALMRLLLDVMRTLSHGLLGRERTASNADDVLLLAAVLIGWAEGRPMGSMKLAAYVGLPRATAIRKLRRLQARGLVERVGRAQYVLGPKAMGSVRAAKAVQVAAKRVGASAQWLEG